jgi:hypothetical protein
MKSVSPHDRRLLPHEREAVTAIAQRLAAMPKPPPQLPDAYARELDRVFGSCGEDGDLEGRGR